MKRIFIILLTISSYNLVFSQRTEDLERIKKLSYLKYVKNMDCDNTKGSNMEHRTCLNLKFQKVDSILNHKIDAYLNSIEKDSLKTRWLKFHNHWIGYRRFQSEVLSEGFRGNMLGIYYLNSMVNLTELKIKELDFLIKI